MAQSSIDLAGLFGTVTQVLAQNQQSLNQADDYNSDHGDNMVRTFETITGALQKKQGSSASTALAYAAKQLSKSSTSGSGKLYAQNLNQAAAQFKGKQIDQRGALDLLQTLIGGGQAPAQGGSAAQGAQPQAPAQGGMDDLLGALLGGMTDGQAQAQPASQGGMDDLLGALLGGMTDGQAQAQPASQGGMDDLLGALLGGGQAQSQPASQGGAGDLLGALLGGGQTSSQGSGQSGLDLGDLLTGAMAFMQARQSGGNTMTALVQAFMAASGMGNSAGRQQSTQIVVNSFLQALSQGAK
jgi:hypothetical protein